MVATLVRILDGNTFVVSDERGDIEASTTDPTGLFSYDTRFLSSWVLTVNDLRLNALSTDDLQYFEARFFLVPATGTVYIDPKLSVIRQRAVGNGFHEELTIISHSAEPSDLTIRIDAASDFADLFEVKDALKKLGTYDTRVDGDRLVLGYQRETFRRETTISASMPAALDEHGLTFTVRVEPHGTWTTDIDVVTSLAGLGIRTTKTKYGRADRQAKPNMAHSLEEWITEAPHLESDWQPLEATYRRSLIDLAALRFSPPVGGGHSLPAAGLPWFMTMFGRDSIFTSLQSLPFVPELAATTLRVLGEWQGTRLDDFRDEDPGRILHEMRYGEMAAFEERPHTPYYGSVDATPLYVILLDEYERWTGDRALVRDLEREARAAINWIDQYADLMGNGYISYKRRNEKTGLENQSWKDSWNSISYADGRLPSFPRATCELQGYAYDAKLRAARLARLVWKDEAYAAAPGGRGRRPQASLQPRLLARRPRLLRDRPRRRRDPGRLAGIEQRPAAVERHRRRQQGNVRRRAPDGSAAVLGLGRPDARGGRGPLQPGRLPPRDGVAVRQLVHRLGPAPLRVQGGGRADRVGDPGRRGGVRRTAPRGVRRLRPCAHPVPGQVPDGVQPAGLVDGRAAAAAADDAGPRAAGRPPRRRPRPAREHRPPRAARHPGPLGPARCLRARPGPHARRSPAAGGPCERRPRSGAHDDQITAADSKRRRHGG